MNGKRFKIDLSAHRSWPFALYFRRQRWHSFITNAVWWEYMGMWDTREQALAHYETIKSLPEYLD